jgi:hypothetical protein
MGKKSSMYLYPSDQIPSVYRVPIPKLPSLLSRRRLAPECSHSLCNIQTERIANAPPGCRVPSINCLRLLHTCMTSWYKSRALHVSTKQRSFFLSLFKQSDHTSIFTRIRGHLISKIRQPNQSIKRLDPTSNISRVLS